MIFKDYDPSIIISETAVDLTHWARAVNGLQKMSKMSCHF